MKAPLPEPAQSPGILRGFCLSAGQDGSKVRLRPVGLLAHDAAARAVEAGLAVPLAGGPLAFGMAEVIVRNGDFIQRAVAALPEIRAWGQGLDVDGQLEALAAPRPAFAGLPMDRPLIMGIVNVTPDSFSDGGDFFDAERATAQGGALLDAGADILDIGGESTRPGAEPVSPEEENRRVLPLVRHFAERGAVVSIDTRHAAVMAACLQAGARIINDITALKGDPDSLTVARRAGAPVILMHMQGEPRSMQHSPSYVDAALDVYDWLGARVAECLEAGMERANLAVDYGIGFGKTVAHNLELLRATALFHGLGVPILVGVSRKSFIGRLSRGEEPKHRIAGSLAAGLAALDQGAQILRVHDVAETVQARAVWAGLTAS